MFDIVTVGSGTLDVFVDTGKGMFRPCSDCPEHVKVPFGSKLLVKELHFFTGGGGTNTAVGFSRLGFRTGWVGKLGDDETGTTILNEMKKERVDSRLVCIAKGMTSGYSIILDAKGHDRTVLAHKGCNDQLAIGEVKPFRSRWMYCSSMLGKSLSALTTLVKKAKRAGTRVAFNPSTYMITDERGAVRRILKHTTALIFNLEEAGLLVGKKPIRAMMRAIHTLGPQFVVVTDGKRGAWGSDGNTVWHCKAPNVPVVESTGAGDSFATGFVGGLMKGLSVPESMKIGMVESASVIQYLGAKNILLSWKQTQSAVKKLGRNTIRVES